jgi:hypothetical protein
LHVYQVQWRSPCQKDSALVKQLLHGAGADVGDIERCEFC